MEKENVTDKKTTVRAVERSLDILSCFIQDRELGLTEISNIIHLNKSTVFRLLNTLEQKGFLIKNLDTDKYHLGYRIWELSTNLNGMDDPAKILLPEMTRLRDILDETISLYVRDGYERIRVQSIESNQAIRRVAPIGMRLPLSVGASSKVLMAFESAEVVDQILHQLEKHYEINRPYLIQTIKEVKEWGYATSFEERETGAAALSFPIINQSGKVIAALSVSGPLHRLTEQKFEEIAPVVAEAASRMKKLVR